MLTALHLLQTISSLFQALPVGVPKGYDLPTMYRLPVMHHGSCPSNPATQPMHPCRRRGVCVCAKVSIPTRLKLQGSTILQSVCVCLCVCVCAGACMCGIATKAAQTECAPQNSAISFH